MKATGNLIQSGRMNTTGVSFDERVSFPFVWSTHKPFRLAAEF